MKRRIIAFLEANFEINLVKGVLNVCYVAPKINAESYQIMLVIYSYTMAKFRRKKI